MAADDTKSSESADSYIGSFISLTSKSEIRYEGFLFHINPQESIIGLGNVKSFGTEGRRKSGPQILPTDKVYEYIFFRGTDIKDLQVISLPPVQSTAAIPNDPAILQSHYPHSTSASTSVPSAGATPPTNLNSNTQPGVPTTTFQGNLPLYQSVGNSGSWGSSPPPSTANDNGHVMPTYQPGFSGSLAGISHLQEQSLLQPPQVLAVSPFQQQMQYLSMNAPLAGATSNSAESLQPGSPNSTSTMLPPSPFPSTFSIGHSGTLASNLSSNVMPNNVSTAFPTVTLGSSSPLVASLAASSLNVNPIVPFVADKPKSVLGFTLPSQLPYQTTPSIVGTSNASLNGAAMPSLVTPGQLLQPGITISSSSHSLQTAHKDTQVIQPLTSEPLLSDSETNQEPIPQLQARPIKKLSAAGLHFHHGNRRYPPGRGNGLNGADLHSHRSNRGHAWGRGNGLNGATLHFSRHNWGNGQGRGAEVSPPLTKFTEDFDFEAMNEKFNKQEVWGLLGKSTKGGLEGEEGDGNESDENNAQGEAGEVLPKFDTKPVYVDDFFDSISCNLLDRESGRGKMKVSEQMRIDIETFGEFQRPQRGRGGRGPSQAGGSRGSYRGRGYGNEGRGRGRTVWCRIS